MNKGVIASLLSSLLFGLMYYGSPRLRPLGEHSVFSIRILFAMPAVISFLYLLGEQSLVIDVFSKIRQQPWLIVIIAFCTVMVGAQIYLFMWAPLNGRGLQVSLGYFLMPLVMVLSGRLFFSEKLTGWQKAAVVCALLGVLNAVFRVGGMSWETLLVALGYPLYFTLRRRVGIGHMGMYWLELVMLTPLALYWLFNNWSALGVQMSVHHDLIWIAPVFGIISTAALQGYMYASKALTFSLFGLLSYVEPVLLAVAAMLLGEVIQAKEWPTYIFIWMAVCLLAVEGVLIVRRQRRTRISTDNLLT